MKVVWRMLGLFVGASLLCTGCNQKEIQQEETGEAVKIEETELPGETVEEGGETIVYYPEEVDNPDNLPVLHWMVINGMTEMKTSVATELNNKLEKEGLPYRVQFVFVTNEDSTIPEIEEKADFLSVFGISQKELAETGYFLPLNDYLDSEAGQELKKVIMADNISFLRSAINGTIYGIPWLYTIANCEALTVDSKVIEEYQITTDELQKEFYDLGDSFEKIYRKNGQEGFIQIPNAYSEKESDIGHVIYSLFFGNIATRYQLLTSCIGVDLTTGEAVNIYETDYVKKTLNAWKDYSEKGYLASNNNNVLIQAHTVAYSEITVKTPDDFYLIPQSELFADSSLSGFTLGVGIVKESDHSEQALDFLTRIHTKEEWMHLLAYGIEGEDYTVQDGTAILSDNGYCEYGLVFGEEFSSITREEAMFLYPQEQGETRKETYLKTLQKTKIYPYQDVSFDMSSLQSKIDEIEVIMEEFSQGFDLSKCEEEELDSLNEKLKAAGIQEIVDEINKQTGYK